MTRDTTDEGIDERLTDPADERPADGDGRAPLANPSRRDVLKASAAVGAAGLGLGLGNSATAATAEEICDSEYGQIDVGGGYSVMDNQWSMSNVPQCVWLNDDGSYGYDFDASNASGGPNYPEVFIGTRPWGEDTGVAEFPIQRRDVDQLEMAIDADYSQSGGEWNWAEEWWLMEQPPGQETGTHVYEIMLLLDWNDQHNHGGMENEAAWTDQYGNTIDHWTTYDGGGTDATFPIFRVQGGYDGGRIDMTEIIDYVSAEFGASGDLWLSGIELGNEYWEGAVGETTYNAFEVTINGSTYTSGSGSIETPETDTPETDTPETDTPETDTPETDTPETDTPETDTPESGDLVASIRPSTTSASTGEMVQFWITDETDGGTWITDLQWELGDGSTDSGWYADARYDSSGSYTVSLTATDNEGNTSTDEVTVQIS